MTKSQELDILRKAASELGADSYLGPWLSFVIPIVERDIRSDNPPATITPQKHAAQIIAEAKEVLRRAKMEAATIIGSAQQQLKDVDQLRVNATHAVAQASRDLEKMALRLS